ncbi:MAG: type II toxin-antitoxin system Phd/YefM family antitoxin [Spirochaetota bacterium]|jgi:prevent-host-death family protein
MRTATFSEFRNNAREYFDRVEKGETIEIYRHGKPVALLSPVRNDGISRLREARPLSIPGVSLSRALLAERDEQP